MRLKHAEQGLHQGEQIRYETVIMNRSVFKAEESLLFFGLLLLISTSFEPSCRLDCVLGDFAKWHRAAVSTRDITLSSVGVSITYNLFIMVLPLVYSGENKLTAFR